jgi:hypothetical protein
MVSLFVVATLNGYSEIMDAGERVKRGRDLRGRDGLRIHGHHMENP